MLQQEALSPHLWGGKQRANEASGELQVEGGWGKAWGGVYTSGKDIEQTGRACIMCERVTLSQHAERNADFLLFQSNLFLGPRSLDLNPLCRDRSTPALCFKENSGSQACRPVRALVPRGRVRSTPGSSRQAGLQGPVPRWRVAPTQNAKPGESTPLT